ncbi:MAG: T9SS type A sorting domain-containing protein, partial [Mariniphaga sp.]|nr:T9SS type A sorting domain-containing protein [Mariniphaga sp.]
VNSNVYITGKMTAGLWFEDIWLGGELFVAKYDSTGGLLWAKPIDGSTMTVSSIATDSEENCYVVGWFSSLLISDTIEIWSENFLSRLFIIKYNKDGETVWINSFLNRNISFKENYRIKPAGISINEKYKHIYITGMDYYDEDGNRDSKLFIAKCSLEGGDLLSFTTIAKSNAYPRSRYRNYGYGIVNDSSSVYICGSMKKSEGKCNFYIAKLDTNLNIIWEKQPVESELASIAYDIALDDENNAYITGYYSDSITIGMKSFTSLGEQDLFIAKYSGEGEFIWAKSAGSAIAGYKGYDFGYSLSFDNYNSIYLSGYVGEDAIFSPETQTQYEGPFLAKLNKFGDYEFVNSYFTGYNSVYEWGAGRVACSPDGSLYFTTNIQDSISLGVPFYKQGLESGGFELYPNPANEVVNFRYNPNQTITSARIINLSGQTVYESKDIKTNQLNIGFLKSGIYLVELEFSDKSRAIQKFIVKKK